MNIVSNSELYSAFIILFIILMCFITIFSIMQLYGLWKIFKKAGYKGWYSIVPFYNYYIMAKIGGVRDMWFFIYLVATFICGFIPYVGAFITIFIAIYYAIEIYASLSKSFGKKQSFTVGIFLLPSIFLFKLGVDESKYNGPKPIGDKLGDILVSITSNKIEVPYNEDTMTKCKKCGFAQDKEHDNCYKCGEKL